MKNMETKELLREAAEAASQAYCPYSDYRVGAALLTTDGRVFRGCNVENASYGLTNCAERTALFAAVAQGYRSFAALAIACSGDEPPYPCGACRQVLVEFCGPNLPVWVAAHDRLDDAESIALGELLPRAFTMNKSPGNSQ
jgi:cytidine deaminase